jgi:flavodoxin
MKLLIVYFSCSHGNNRLLTNHLGKFLGADFVEVKERHRPNLCCFL